ncbi:MAG: hypothetical protein E7668_00340 [Ruminococcaceae bacterium]|nr:hypothetical protein [Oscillospiraceae bacterium]
MKKNREKNGEKKRSSHRFKALDAVIILLVLTAVVGVYFRYNIFDLFSKNKDMQDYYVSFSIEDVRYTTPNYINIGDRVYYSDGEELGVLVAESEDMSNLALSVTPASELFLNDDGTMEEVFYPNNESRVNAKGRMQCRGTYTAEGGFLVNGSNYLSSGQSLSVHTETVTVTIEIQNIEAVN